MKIYDILWKRQENNIENPIWERVGVLLIKEEGKISIKLNLIPSSNWDGWLVVSERRPKDEVPF